MPQEIGDIKKVRIGVIVNFSASPDDMLTFFFAQFIEICRRKDASCMFHTE